MEYIGMVFDNLQDAVNYAVLEFATADGWNSDEEALGFLEGDGALRAMKLEACKVNWEWPQGAKDLHFIKGMEEAAKEIRERIQDGSYEAM